MVVGHSSPQSLADRGPLRVMFVITSMPVGGAETLLVNLVRRLDRARFAPELCCLKELGPLGEELAREIPAHAHLLESKWDVSIFWRLASLFRERKIDAVVTVGAGDKMFWGRLSAWWAGVPVICSALHSTGWPDGVGLMNRWLTPLTDAFIAVAAEHGRYLVSGEGFPADKVRVIPNGIDVERFRYRPEAAQARRQEFGIGPDAPVAGILAALRPEKNHALFLRAAAQVHARLPEARFLIIGDGPERPALESLVDELQLGSAVIFAGTRSDVPELLCACDLLALSSDNEANPVSILEAMSVGLPIVATRVGSIPEMVLEGATGYLAPVGDAAALAARMEAILSDGELAAQLGAAGRQRVVRLGSLDAMVRGYEELLAEIYGRKTGVPVPGSTAPAAPPAETAAANCE